MKATANNREIVVKLSTNDGPVQFYFRTGAEYATLYKMSVGKNITTDSGLINEQGQQLIVSLSEWPPEGEINFAVIDIIRSTKGKN